jgi:acetyltransferase-like isoleucine patch superfamily enzyme
MAEALPIEVDPCLGPLNPCSERPEAAAESPPHRVYRVLHDETRLLRPRLLLVRGVASLLPHYVGSRLRVSLLRAIGIPIGPGTIMWGMPTFTGERDLRWALRIGALCRFNIGCLIDVNAPVTIGDRVGFGQQVMILTGTHEVAAADRRSGRPYARPVTIGDGCWIGARVTILPGVRIGSGSIVAAGALVRQDVPSDVIVAGVPARPVKALEP